MSAQRLGPRRRRGDRLDAAQGAMLRAAVAAVLGLALAAAVAGSARAGAPGAFDAGWRAGGRTTLAAQGASFLALAVRPVGDRLRVAGVCTAAGAVEGCAATLDAGGDFDPDWGDPASPDRVVRSGVAGLPATLPPLGASMLTDVDSLGRVAWLRVTDDGAADIARLDAAGLGADVPPRAVDLRLGDPGAQLVSVLQSSGDALYVGGAVATTPGNFDAVLARLDATLGPDAAFDGDGVLRLAFDAGQPSEDQVRDLVVAPGGRVHAVVQVIPQGAATVSFWVVAIEADGAMAEDFGIAGRTQVPIEGATTMQTALDGEGRVLLAGRLRAVGGVQAHDIYIARLTPEGLFDPAFGTDGVQRLVIDATADGGDIPRDVLAQPVGAVVVVGRAQDGPDARRLFAARLDASGAPDVGFGTAGVVVAGFDAGVPDALDDAVAAALDDERRLYVVGVHTPAIGVPSRAGVARLLTGLPGDAAFGDGFE